MKTPKFMVFWVCLALAIFTSSATHSQSHEEPKLSTDKLEDEFLGLHLGCSLEELQGALKKSTNPIKLIKKDVVDGMTTYFYSGNHRLNGATGTSFSFWDGKLSVVTVFFKTEEAAKIYDALKMKMEEKYAKMNNGIKFSGKKCTLIKGGMHFSLELETNPLEADTVLLVAAHLGIMAAKEAKEVEKKAKDLGNL
ncbi:MAG: hypothetical protein JRJ79_11190 [Deltaproteobacteria bacterium]|nr:hypothetical protein [Deltaproteobacteria bacterium]